MTTLPPAPAYRPAVRDALLLQLFLTIILATVLDGGRLAIVGACAILGFWSGAAIIILRRPLAPRKLDVLYVRFGTFLIFVVAIGIAGAINWMRGSHETF